MMKFLAQLGLLAVLAIPALAAEDAAPTHPLVGALALTESEAQELPAADLLLAADWLHGWSMASRAPVAGTPEKFEAALRKSFLLYRLAAAKAPQNPKVYWKHAFANYTLGELLPAEEKAKRTALYEEMISLTERCLKLTKKEAGCWHFWAVGQGRLATTKGIVSSMMVASDLEAAWKKAIALKPQDVHVWGDPLLPGIEYALAVFYRLVPDMWIVKTMIGTRGDKPQSVALMRKAVAAQPYRLEVQKELGVSLVCLGLAKDDKKALEEGRALFQRILAGEFDREDVRATDPIDKRHVADMLKRPELACKYSRDGYQEVDVEAAKPK